MMLENTVPAVRHPEGGTAAQRGRGHKVLLTMCSRD
jgi:hypothetical protein